MKDTADVIFLRVILVGLVVATFLSGAATVVMFTSGGSLQGQLEVAQIGGTAQFWKRP